MATSVQASKISIGVDIIEIGRIKRAIATWQDSFLNRIYTRAELECSSNISSLAARFAAKEAVMKALGTGMKGVGWRDIEILTNEDGAPFIRLYGRAFQKSIEIGVSQFSLTMSHSRKYTVAFVIGNAK